MNARTSSWIDKAMLGLAACGFALLASCGGGGGGDNATAMRGAGSGTSSVSTPFVPGANVLQVLVDTGTDGTSINTPFVTVRVCQPGTTTCADIDHVVLDTGSSGLRVAASALPAGFALAPITNSDGNAVGQCAQFASGFSWGSVRVADVRMGGEVASSLPIQVVNDPAAPYSQVPASCSSTGPNIGSGRGANGILGVGFFKEDCGSACDVGVPGAPNFYYGCTGGGACTPSRLALANQVSNPVISFGANNNGVVVVMPPVPTGGAGEATGSLILGVATQANNQLAGATIFSADAQGFFTTTYKGVSFPASFLDSGSNGLFFNDAALPSCGDFYCPGTTPLSLTATNTSASGLSAPVDFFIDSITAIRPGAAAAHIGGTNGIPGSFDYGLPFFFGRSVFVGYAAPNGPGPFWAY
ncbi:DUF3443 family protein [Ramlibacter sp. Leaf400]|uniref:DUF3443 family protein n=1 Tax=Ramlibacter sp. Leaf400 TaxID=1736365 RepID=UPI0006F99D16|nr:DUF3443 family protein [Ramlibacter sp. Leaf400]KQT10229.1 hypothetical protein ASG30_10260 [Ramlibacter sp. Leaf400]